MDKSKRNSPQLDDFRDLLPIIQSLLPAKEAARTCVLSKAWLHSWYTMPALSFPQSAWLFREQERKFMTYIDHTLLRYHRDNIPLNSIYLDINIREQETASLAEKWIRSVASKSTLKELNLTIFCAVPSFSLTDEIFSGRNLDTLSVTLDTWMIGALWMSINPVINCESLRVLELINVHISEEVLDKLLSTCRLLEKICLEFYKGFKTIKVKNLLHLRELKINSRGQDDILKIDNVPSLRLFSYDSLFEQRTKPLPFNTSSLGGVTELYLDGVIIEDAFLAMIQFIFPFLDSLTLRMKHYSRQVRLDIKCVSLKRLTLGLIKTGPIQIQVYAPKLTFFSYDGRAIPSLLFPAAAPEQIELKTSFLGENIDHSFSFKTKQALNLPSKFHIIEDFISPPLINMDDVDGLRRNVSFPAMNMQHKASSAADSWDHSLFLDAVFTICHPSYVRANQCPSYKDKNYLCKIMIREVMKKESREGHWPDYLQDVTIKDLYNCKVYQIIGE